jgi:8-oxo-dGTP pyrophosphatase MutT (NUDIX family)
VTSIPVIAAIIRRGERYLVGRRPAGKRHGGLWEFPGGKLLDGEDWLAAARRELAEELCIEVASVGEVLLTATDPDSPFDIHFVEVEVAPRVSPEALEHSEVGWFTADELHGLPMAPADAQMVSRLLVDPPRDPHPQARP